MTALNHPVWPSRLRVLRVLATTAPLSSLAVARGLEISVNHAAVLLTGLARRGLVQRVAVGSLERHAHPHLKGVWLLTPAAVVMVALPLTAWRPLGHLAALGDVAAQVLREPALLEMNGGLVLERSA